MRKPSAETRSSVTLLRLAIPLRNSQNGNLYLIFVNLRQFDVDSYKFKFSRAIGITVEDGKLGLYLHLEKFDKSYNKEFICDYNVELGAPNEKFQPLISRSGNFSDFNSQTWAP